MRWFIPLVIPAVLSGCAVFQQTESPVSPGTEAPTTRPEPRPEATATETVEVGAAGQTAEALDTTTAAERAEATAPSGGGSALGQTVASLGDPTEQGFWLKTPLVSSETEGRVEAASGASVNVTLIPIDGPGTAGSRISLAAMRALGLGLTDLPTVSVFKG